MKRHHAIAVILVVLALPVWAQPARPIAVSAITIGMDGEDVVVAIDGDGPLPSPTVGALDGPPRIFLDFPGVIAKARGIARSRDPRLQRVRIAQHSLQPLVTRVVLDLFAQQPHRIESTSTRVKVVLGAATSPVPTPPASAALPRPMPPPSAPVKPPPTTTDAPPSSTSIPLVPPLPDPTPRALTKAPGTPRRPDPATTTSFKPPPTPPPLKDIEKFRGQVLATVDRFRMQLPLLSALENGSLETPEQIEAVGLEIDRIKQELAALKPPDSLRVQHDLLVQSARMAGLAIRLRAEALQTDDGNILRNAASAAAGAILMLDRACADVGCPER
jgi:hypothetical protein